MNIGHFNQLSITRFTDHGAILDAGNGEEILMPKRYVENSMHAGDQVNVFVYFDQSDRLVATTETPLAEVGMFAYLRVAWTNSYGAFMNWGLMKDLFVPFSEQRHHFMQGRNYLVYIYIDDKTGRIVGTSKVDRCLSHEPPHYHQNDKVDILVWKQTDMGFKVIIDNAFEGLIYQNEIFCDLHIGDKRTAIIKNIRPDGKIDVSLQETGRKHVDSLTTKLLIALSEADGFLPYNDQSTPEEIAQKFQVSKKAFKRALGALYKDHLIELLPDGIKRV